MNGLTDPQVPQPPFASSRESCLTVAPLAEEPSMNAHHPANSAPQQAMRGTLSERCDTDGFS